MQTTVGETWAGEWRGAVTWLRRFSDANRMSYTNRGLVAARNGVWCSGEPLQLKPQGGDSNAGNVRDMAGETNS